MITVIRGRRGGKTTELIKMAHKRGGVIICHNRIAVDYIYRQALELMMPIREPITFQQFISGNAFYGDKVEEVYIDELLLCLQQVSRPIVHAVSLTPQPEDYEQD